jgi:hypothetical protein
MEDIIKGPEHSENASWNSTLNRELLEVDFIGLTGNHSRTDVFRRGTVVQCRQEHQPGKKANDATGVEPMARDDKGASQSQDAQTTTILGG